VTKQAGGPATCGGAPSGRELSGFEPQASNVGARTQATPRFMLSSMTHARRSSEGRLPHWGIGVHTVSQPLPFLPQAALYHPVVELNERLRSFQIEVLDVVDVVVSKLARFHGNDRSDISAMVDLDLGRSRVSV
jgi:hypothetical protein